MRRVEVSGHSFPKIENNSVISFSEGTVWQVLCGDENHWRCGIYSPKYQTESEINELEKHSCPELFLLLEGEISLILIENNRKSIIKLEKNKPILVDTWHNGFCPNGEYTGKALVIERDNFYTDYEDKDILLNEKG